MAAEGADCWAYGTHRCAAGCTSEDPSPLLLCALQVCDGMMGYQPLAWVLCPTVTLLEMKPSVPIRVSPWHGLVYALQYNQKMAAAEQVFTKPKNMKT